MNDTNTQPPNGPDRSDAAEGSAELLPGWSSLVILLTTFAAIAAITLIALMRSADQGVYEEEGGTVAMGPADFPEIGWNAPLMDSVVQAAESEEGGVYNVPPPPFKEEGIYPCSDCHADLEVNYERRELEDFHFEIQLDHGPEDRWCFDCHSPDNRDKLQLVGGRLVDFDASYELCGQCHGTIYRDWRVGIHGRRRGFWDGAKSYLLCAHCHDPHAPAFAPMEPLPPPVRPQLKASNREERLEAQAH